MYKVILVDDEIWSLEGLEASFKWEENGFQVVGKYTDSLEAAVHIGEKKPDVVFTDIRMPELTGLELMEKVRGQNREVEFVVVSGYAEFDYARQAVRQGACDYLLKPVDLDETDAILERLKKTLEYRRASEDELLLQRILYEGQEEERLAPIARSGRVQAAVILGDGMEASACLSLQKYLKRQGRKYVLLIPSGKKLVLLYEAFEGEQEEEWLRQLEILGKKLYIGLSQTGPGENVKTLMKEAILAASGKFIGTGAGITRYRELVNPYYETYGKRLGTAILGKCYEEACGILDEITGLVKQEELGIFYIVRLWNQIAILLHGNLVDSPSIKIEYLDFMHISRRFDSLESLAEYLKIEIAEILVCQRKQMEMHKDYNENFMHLLQYVEENYSRKLSLNSLAEQFFLNMSYCSELFKKVTGLNFSDYLTKLRMEKAAELLSTGKYKVKDVAEMTGYHDAFYFSKVMKKYFGVTPARLVPPKEGGSVEKQGKEEENE